MSPSLVTEAITIQATAIVNVSALMGIAVATVNIIPDIRHLRPLSRPSIRAIPILATGAHAITGIPDSVTIFNVIVLMDTRVDNVNIICLPNPLPVQVHL